MQLADQAQFAPPHYERNPLEHDLAALTERVRIAAGTGINAVRAVSDVLVGLLRDDLLAEVVMAAVDIHATRWAADQRAAAGALAKAAADICGDHDIRGHFSGDR